MPLSELSPAAASSLLAEPDVAVRERVLAQALGLRPDLDERDGILLDLLFTTFCMCTDEAKLAFPAAGAVLNALVRCISFARAAPGGWAPAEALHARFRAETLALCEGASPLLSLDDVRFVARDVADALFRHAEAL